MTRLNEKSPHRLLVEGRDDQWALINLLSRHDLDFGDEKARRPPQAGLPFVMDCKSVEQLLVNVGPAVKTCRRVGVVLDADHPPYDRWAQVRGALERVGLRSPERPAAGGTIVPGHEEGWQVGVWLMPDNVAYGMLEDFLARLIPGEDRCWPHATDATARARELGAPLKELRATKGAMHTWLAWQDPSGQPFGTALHSRALRHDAPEALAFLQWFRRLFELATLEVGA